LNRAAFRDRPDSKVVYIAPLKALVKERVKDWTRRVAQPLGRRLVELTGDVTPDLKTIEKADIIVTTPEKWDGISRSWRTRGYVRKVSLVIIVNSLKVIVRMKFIYLEVNEGLY
jgi:antiviral helicase SLH1